MPVETAMDADWLCQQYFDEVTAMMRSVLSDERDPLDRAAERLTDQIAADRLVHVFGPGGHSNLATQEIFFRAGGLMHISAILDVDRRRTGSPESRRFSHWGQLARPREQHRGRASGAPSHQTEPA